MIRDKIIPPPFFFFNLAHVLPMLVFFLPRMVPYLKMRGSNCVSAINQIDQWYRLNLIYRMYLLELSVYGFGMYFLKISMLYISLEGKTCTVGRCRIEMYSVQKLV